MWAMDWNAQGSHEETLTTADAHSTDWASRAEFATYERSVHEGRDHEGEGLVSVCRAFLY